VTGEEFTIKCFESSIYKDKIRNTVIKQKMNVARSLLEDIKTKITSILWTCSENGRGEITKRSYEMEPTRKKKTR
jgi:hypothetical protein